MHALIVDLWPWLVAFYLADGIAQLGRGHLLLVSGGGPFAAIGAGLHLPGLSPLAEAVALHDLPWLAGDGSLHRFDPRRRSEPAVVERIDLESVPLASLRPVTREGRRVLAAGRLLLVAPSAEGAELERWRLDDLAGGAAPTDGPDLAAELSEVRALRRRQAPWVFALRLTGAALAVAVGAIWPLVAYGPAEAAPLGAPLLLAVAGLVLLTAGLVFGMVRAAGGRTGEAAAAALHLLVLPVAALHPLWSASRALYRRFDPLTVAAALLPPDRFALLAAREHRRAAFSRLATPPELAPAWEGRSRRLEALLTAVGIPLRAAFAPPARHADCAGWCPLCRSQLRAGFDRCGDCGVPVEPFDREDVSPG